MDISKKAARVMMPEVMRGSRGGDGWYNDVDNDSKEEQDNVEGR